LLNYPFSVSETPCQWFYDAINRSTEGPQSMNLLLAALCEFIASGHSINQRINCAYSSKPNIFVMIFICEAARYVYCVYSIK